LPPQETKDGYGDDDDSSVSSYDDDLSSTESSLSSSSSVSSGSSVSSYSSSSSSDDDDYDDGFGGEYESTDGFLQDIPLYNDIMDGEKWRGRDYNLDKYEYGMYLNETESKIQTQINDVKDMDRLLFSETKPLSPAKGKCLPRYTFPELCQSLNFVKYKRDGKDVNEIGTDIKETIINLEQRLEEQKKVVLYNRNMTMIMKRVTENNLPKLSETVANDIISKFSVVSGKIVYDGTTELKNYIETHNVIDDTLFLAVNYHFCDQNHIPPGVQFKEKMPTINLIMFNEEEEKKEEGEEEDDAENDDTEDDGVKGKKKAPKQTDAKEVTNAKQLTDAKKPKFVAPKPTVKSKPIPEKSTSKKYVDMILKAQGDIDAYQKDYENAKNEFYRRFCNKHRFNKLLFNLRLRINEGMMINHSLAELRKDIKAIMLNSVSLVTDSGEVFLPIVYDNTISPAIRNTYLEDNYFENFITTNTNKQPINGQIMLTIQNEFKVDVDKIHIALFTVINLTDSDDGPINNPPNPPYINISKLIYYLPQKVGGMSRVADVNKIVSVFKEMLSVVDRYDFYKTNETCNVIRKKADDELKKFAKTDDKGNITYVLSNTQDFVTTIYDPFIQTFMELIQQNNPSSLIGSLESTDMLRSFTFNKIVGYFNNDINKTVFNKYKSFGLEYYNEQFKDQKDKTLTVIMSDQDFVKKIAMEIS
jgi:hypothetical protein